MQNIESIMVNKSFEEIQDLEKDGVRVRTLNATEEFKKLYLLVSSKFDTKESHVLNGQIYEKGTNELVADAPNAVFENESIESLNIFLEPIKSFDESGNETNNYCEENEIITEYAEDGTLVRLYNFNGVWYTATTRCISGEYSYWEDRKRTFDGMFREVLVNFDYSLLDKECTYNFLLKHINNRLVVAHAENELVFISRIKQGVETLDCPECLLGYIRLPLKVKSGTVTMDTITEEYDEYKGGSNYTSVYCTNMDVNVDLTGNNWTKSELDALLVASFNNTKKGIIFVRKCGSKYSRLLYETPEYRKIKELKGNTPNVLLTFTDLYTKGSVQDLNTFSMVFAERTTEFHEHTRKLEELVNEVFNKYVDTHIKQRYRISETDKDHRTLRQLHAVHKQTRRTIHLDTVRDLVYNLDSKIIFRLMGVNVYDKRVKKEFRPKRILKRGETL
jgi:hypothetical protein